MAKRAIPKRQLISPTLVGYPKATATVIANIWIKIIKQNEHVIGF
jgi:hypothetical protein